MSRSVASEADVCDAFGAVGESYDVDYVYPAPRLASFSICFSSISTHGCDNLLHYLDFSNRNPSSTSLPNPSCSGHTPWETLTRWTHGTQSRRYSRYFSSKLEV